MFWYLPLPAYKERYTEYLSTENGVVETFLKANHIPYTALRPVNRLHHIKDGIVLDPNVMCYWGFWQSQHLVAAIMDDSVEEGDIIYFEDFWHPGMEMIPYALSLKGMFGKVKLTAHNYAQSVDVHDFTSKLMFNWIPAFEEAWSGCLDHIFVADEDLADLSSDAWIGYSSSFITAVGTIFSSEVLLNLWQAHEAYAIDTKRKLRVVYSSRFDEEKDPMFFLDVVEQALKLESINLEFVICTGAKILRGDAKALARLNKLVGSKIRVATELTKIQYFSILASSAVQMNTAKQDHVSYVLLDATTFGCVPFYTNSNPSFCNALGDSKVLLFDKSLGAEFVARQLIQLAYYGASRIIGVSSKNEFKWVYRKYDRSIYRMMNTLGVIDEDIASLEDEVELSKIQAKEWDSKFIERMKQWEGASVTGGLVRN